MARKNQTVSLTSRRAAEVCVVACTVLLLAACGASNKPMPVVNTSIPLVQLTADQMHLVENGVKQMLVAEAPSEAEIKSRLEGITAFRHKTRPGLQICGEVHYQPSADSVSQKALFYVEMSDGDGEAELTRGQIGSDKLKSAKIRFMCHLPEKSSH